MKSKRENYRCPVCDKLIIFKDEIIDHAMQEHGHSPEYLEGYIDCLKELSSQAKNKFVSPYKSKEIKGGTE